MKKYNFLLVVILSLLLFKNKGLAQNQYKIDSLKQLINRTSSDSVMAKINAYKNICWEYAVTRSKLDSARFYADSVKILSQKINYQDGIAQSHFYYGVIGRFSGNYYEGLNHLDKYLDYYQKLGDSLKVEAGLFQRGVIHYNLGNYAESLVSYYRILAIYKKRNMQSSIATAWHSIGHIQRKMNKYNDAIESYKKSIKIKENFNDKSGVLLCLISLGNTYGEQKKYVLAEEKMLEAHKLSKEINTPYLTASVLESLGNIYQESSSYQKAHYYYKEALNIRKGLPSKKDIAISLNALGVNNISLKKYKKAEEYLLKSLEISKEIDVRPILLKNYKALKELSQTRRNFKEALKYQDAFIIVKDSIFNRDKNKQMVELETKYKVAQKEQEIALLTKENQLQEAKSQKEADLRKALIVGLILLTIIGGLLFYSMRQRLRNQKMLVEKNEEIKRSQYREQLQVLEMKALRAQMNPHFLFNSLNSINTMILSDENDNARKYLSKFSKLVRLMLENSEQSHVSLKDEISMLETYIQLEALRFNNKIEYKIEVDKTINQEDTYLPSMVLQPFVENAIWHGLLHNDKKGLLTIIIKEDAENLYCSIIDNGVGRDKSLTLQKEGGLKKKSMGIKITTERLRLLTQQKINEVIAIIDLKDENNNAIGTQVNIQIPLS